MKYVEKPKFVVDSIKRIKNKLNIKQMKAFAKKSSLFEYKNRKLQVVKLK